jgi:AIPR protein
MYEVVLNEREDLKQYGNNSLLLFALEMKFGIEDIHTVAADALTDGSDDKKCDLVYINLDEGSAVIAQAYYSQDSSKQEAPANKASDLNTAAAWLLGRELTELPDRIRPAATQLREALKKGLIKTIQFWYVHNLSESQNVKNELKTVQRSASNSLRQLLSTTFSLPNVVAQEVGSRQLEDWYKALTTQILVVNHFEVDIIGGYKISSDDWVAFVTAVPAKWLHQIFDAHQSDLFSANIRGYLGSRKVDANINNGIKNTASEDPNHFWVYNNGLTILTHNFNYDESKNKLLVEGISIVNGAQTTGAVGSLEIPPDSNAMVPARFVQCNKREVITRIIQFNNSQNQVEAPDFRSGDDIQKRLRDEFELIPSVTYLGGRRGGVEDRMKRPANLLPSDTAGQALAAFHDKVLIAYNEKSKIWISDSYYSNFFSNRTTAKHIVFVYSLLRAVEKRKKQLSNDKDLTSQQNKILSFFRNRGATFLLASAIAASLEIILGKPIDDKFSLVFRDNLSPQIAIDVWEPIVNVSGAFSERLMLGLEGGLNNAERVKRAISDFTSFMEATVEVNKIIYSKFSDKVQIDGWLCG